MCTEVSVGKACIGQKTIRSGMSRNMACRAPSCAGDVVMVLIENDLSFPTIGKKCG